MLLFLFLNLEAEILIGLEGQEFQKGGVRSVQLFLSVNLLIANGSDARADSKWLRSKEQPLRTWEANQVSEQSLRMGDRVRDQCILMGRGPGIHLRLPVKTLEEKHHRYIAKMEVEQCAQKTEVSSSQTGVVICPYSACQLAGKSSLQEENISQSLKLYLLFSYRRSGIQSKDYQTRQLLESTDKNQGV